MRYIFRRKNDRRIGAVVLMVAFAAASATSQEQIPLPPPTGQFALGRTTLEWRDKHRGNRPIQAVVWYPAIMGSPDAPYYGGLERVLQGSAAEQELRSSFGAAFDDVSRGRISTHARLKATPQKGKFPLLLFSPGLGLSPYDYSVQLEDLASRGYVIAAISHPGDTASFVLADGTMVPSSEEFWATHPPEPQNALAYEQHAEQSAKDLLFVIEQLERAESPVSKAINFRKIGAFGHSQGGRVAADACEMDARIEACLNEDGRLDEDTKLRPYWPIAGRTNLGSFAMLDWFDSGLSTDDFESMHTSPAAFAHSHLLPGKESRGAYEAVHGDSYRVTLLRKGMAHLAFSDIKWITARDQRARNEAAANLKAIRSLVAAFFDQQLKGIASPELRCDRSPEDLVVQCFSRSKQKPRR